MKNNKKLKFLVKRYGSGSNYHILYKYTYTNMLRFINFLIPYSILTRTYHNGFLTNYPDRDHPVLNSSFDNTVRLCETYKKDPILLENFIDNEDLKYKKIYKEVCNYQKSINKSAEI